MLKSEDSPIDRHEDRKPTHLRLSSRRVPRMGTHLLRQRDGGHGGSGELPDRTDAGDAQLLGPARPVDGIAEREAGDEPAVPQPEGTPVLR